MQIYPSYDATKEIRAQETEKLEELWVSKKNQLGLTQVSLSNKFGYKAPTIYDYIHGITPLNLPFAVGFATELQVSIADISPRLTSLVLAALRTMETSIFSPLLALKDIGKFINNEFNTQEILDFEQLPSKRKSSKKAFWVKLSNDSMQSNQPNTTSLLNGSYFMIEPNHKEGKFALITFKNSAPSEMGDIVFDDYAIRKIVRDGDTLKAVPLNPDFKEIEIVESQIVGSIVEAIYPLEDIFK